MKPTPTRMTRDQPIGYFITFTTYGTWLHGRTEGSVDRDHNEWQSQPLPAGSRRRGGMEKAMGEDPLTLSDAMREVVRSAIVGVCAHRGWVMRALNVRTNHLHVVIGAAGVNSPEKAMIQFKAWSTRRLREAGLLELEREHVWTRHDSTRWLFTAAEAEGAIDYVLNHQ